MGDTLLLILIGGALLLAALWLWSRRRAAQRPPAARQPPAAEAQSPAAPAWMPPHYAAPQAAAPAGPSLKASINIIRPQGDALLVSWTAVVDGAVPVAVQWGAPAIHLGEGDALQLRYTVDAAAGVFRAPEARVCQPGEIVSRSANVARSEIGRDFAGLRVTVALGYGAADEHAAASALADAYQAWQRVAVSPPRVVPRS